MEEQIVRSRTTQRTYKISEMVRISNLKQIALYIKNGVTLYDLFCRIDIDPVTKEETPKLVAYFNKAESKWAYDLWEKRELR